MGGSKAHQWLRHALCVRGVCLQGHRLLGGYMDHGCSSRWVRLSDRHQGFLASHAGYPHADTLVSLIHMHLFSISPELSYWLVDLALHFWEGGVFFLNVYGFTVRVQVGLHLQQHDSISIQFARASFVMLVLRAWRSSRFGIRRGGLAHAPGGGHDYGRWAVSSLHLSSGAAVPLGPSVQLVVCISRVDDGGSQLSGGIPAGQPTSGLNGESAGESQ